MNDGLFKGIIPVAAYLVPVEGMLSNANYGKLKKINIFKRNLLFEYDIGAEEYEDELSQIYGVGTLLFPVGFPKEIEQKRIPPCLLSEFSNIGTGVIRYGAGQHPESEWFEERSDLRVVYSKRSEKRKLAEKGAGRINWGAPNKIDDGAFNIGCPTGNPIYYLEKDKAAVITFGNPLVEETFLFDTEMLRGGLTLNEAQRDFQAALFLKALARKEGLEIRTLTPLAVLRPLELPLKEGNIVSAERYIEEVGRIKYSHPETEEYRKKDEENERNMRYAFIKLGLPLPPTHTKQAIPKEVGEQIVFYYYGAEQPEKRIEPKTWGRSKEEATSEFLIKELKQNILTAWNIQDKEAEKGKVAEKFTDRISAITALAHRYESVFTKYHPKDKETRTSSLDLQNVTPIGEVLDLESFRSVYFGHEIEPEAYKNDIACAKGSIKKFCGALGLNESIFIEQFENVYEEIAGKT